VAIKGGDRGWFYSPAPDDEPNVCMRVKYLGDHRPASTVVCCQLLDPTWKLEMEVVAAT
jgi:enamine deaminase RidA (YjgF/YER057c/UK114 family)